MPNTFTAILVLALVAAAGTGAVVHRMDANGEVRTIGGIVTEIAWNRYWEVAVEYGVRMNDAEGTMYAVELGPPWWWAAVGLPDIRLNDTLAVDGIVHDGNAIEAYTVSVNGGETVMIRDGDKPAWAEVASGRPAKDD